MAGRMWRAASRWRADAGVEIVDGRARLRGPGEIEVAGRVLRCERVLIATGGMPARDTLSGLALTMTYNEVLELHDMPASLLVIGGS